MSIRLIKLIIKLKNASILKKKYINIRYSKLYANLLKILYKEGFIQSISYDKTKLNLKIYLKYYHGKPIFKELTFFSIPSKKYYLPFFNLEKLNDLKKLTLLSTNKGILTLSECKKQKVGGTLLFVCN